MTQNLLAPLVKDVAWKEDTALTPMADQANVQAQAHNAPLISAAWMLFS